MGLLAGLFGRRLWLTNTVGGGLLLAGGDAIQQTVEIRRGLHQQGRYNWPRTGRMLLVGLAMGPPHHLWYTWLDRWLPARTGAVVRRKILADQLVAAPFFAVGFFFGMGWLEGKSTPQCSREFKDKFPEVYLFDWFIWPPTQWVNFMYVPDRYRVMYVNVVTVLWDVFLSYIKHRDQLQRVTCEGTRSDFQQLDAPADGVCPPTAETPAAVTFKAGPELNRSDCLLTDSAHETSPARQRHGVS